MASVENTMRQQPLQSMDTTRLHFIDNDDTSSSTLTEHTLMICRRPHSTSPEISEGVKVQVSLMNDEFADIQCIPETPQKSTGTKRPLEPTTTGDVKDQCIQVQLPLKLERRVNKRRTESIRSDEDTQRARSTSGATPPNIYVNSYANLQKGIPLREISRYHTGDPRQNHQVGHVKPLS
ncbi:hypothetical protein FPOAC1_009202 [Fusarium poae]|uniref:hypothetical protein n=1 Tax=Fusarium poae TaxID=36050 RepID=UPI001CEAEF38|nr:hypothetical protein FPOAC1_009202 [Fusarium poae]KAG8669803.1 hypothetical protein FPOAC1_009202 [Fusarium poae]